MAAPSNSNEVTLTNTSDASEVIPHEAERSSNEIVLQRTASWSEELNNYEASWVSY